MIRILLDHAFDNERHYIHAVGLSTDAKPIMGIITGSKFVEVDTGAAYFFDETAGEWNESQQLTAAVTAYLEEHPEAVDQAAIEAMFGDQLDGIDKDISGLKSAFADTKVRTMPFSQDWTQGTIYSNGDGTFATENTNIRCRLTNMRPMYGLATVEAKAGYLVNYLVAVSDGTSYGVCKGDANWGKKFDVSRYSDEYCIYFAVRKDDNSEITTSEAKANVIFSTLPTSTDKTYIDDSLAFHGSKEKAAQEQAGKMYYTHGKSIISVGNGYMYKYNIDSVKRYYFSSSGTVGGVAPDFSFVNYFDSTDTLIGFEYPLLANIFTGVTKAALNPPSNAAYMLINGRNAIPEVYSVPVVTDDISILFVGNSLTQDGIAYLPYLLRTYYPGIRFRFYMYYNGGYTLAQQYSQFDADTACEIFSAAENSPAWTNANSTVKMSSVLSTYKFDIVCMQEYFNHKATYTDSDLADWNNCRDYISSHYTGGNGLEFISLFHAPLRSDADTIYALTGTGNGLILQKTISEDMIPIGMAVYRALSTDLDSLGDQGHLSPDGVHTQEGLPCLLQTYTALLWLFDKLGINKSVYGCPMRMTTAIYNTINVPGPNLGTGVITGTDAQNLLAQEVAIQAYKEGKAFVAKNIYVEPS